MSNPDAVRRAIKKYEAEKVDRIIIRVPKGKREQIASFAKQHGESTNGFISRAIDEAMEKEK